MPDPIVIILQWNKFKPNQTKPNFCAFSIQYTGFLPNTQIKYTIEFYEALSLSQMNDDWRNLYGSLEVNAIALLVLHICRPSATHTVYIQLTKYHKLIYDINATSIAYTCTDISIKVKKIYLKKKNKIIYKMCV